MIQPRKYSSEPCMSSSHIGNGYGHFLDIDAAAPEPYTFEEFRKDKIRIRIPKTPENSDDENENSEPDKGANKKAILIGIIYIAAVSFIAIEYFMFVVKR